MHSALVRTIALVAAVLFQLPTARAEAATILFDKGHGQRFLMEKTGPLDLSELEKVFRTQGLTVQYREGTFSDETLAQADGLMISGPFSPIGPEEANAVARFVQRGGRVAVMLHIGTPLAELIHRLGVDVSNAVIHERDGMIGDESINFMVRRLSAHPVLDGVRQFGFYGGWALVNTDPSAEIIAATSAEAWVDLDRDRKLSAADATQSFGVVASGRRGNGEFLIFGDDAIFQNKFLTDGNRRLGENLGSWFGGRNAAAPAPTGRD